MKIKEFEIGVTWRYRKQTLKQCTEDVIIFLERLKNFDTNLGIWYKTGWSKKEAQKEKIKFEYGYVRNLFYKINKYRDDDFPEFMFDCSVWNGAENDNQNSKDTLNNPVSISYKTQNTSVHSIRKQHTYNIL